jgi:DNA-binding HxlR family transcriptional regulator
MKRQETGNFRERFGALRRLVEAVSDTMLIQELKEMVADGIAVRRDYHEIPPRPELPLRDVARGSLCDWAASTWSESKP